jgi:hypothetical protein
LISRLGGWVADPGSAEEVAEVVRQFLSFVWDKRHDLETGWGRVEVREEFEAKAVARRFQEVLMELV